MVDNEKIMSYIGETPSDLVFWSFRYFLGRRTIHANVFAQNLAKAYPYLDDVTQSMIKREIERAIELDDLGDECDKEVWLDVLRNISIKFN